MREGAMIRADCVQLRVMERDLCTQEEERTALMILYVSCLNLEDDILSLLMLFGFLTP